ncbi:MAG TPA: PD-(D/E)XK nuclease family protein [Chthoniobacterales bacterium]|nr:PD-(D/E)XK nuclease family protein [Chthoniobacterales bacterium]
MQLELELQPRRRHDLLLASSPDAEWHGAIADWLRKNAAASWRGEGRALVVVPTRGQAESLKSRMLEADLSAIGLQFLTPPYLRALLVAEIENRPAPADHLRLLLALAAEELLGEKKLSEAEHLAAVSVRRTPNHLLRLLEQLSAAGAEFDGVDLPAFRAVVRRFRQHLKSTNLLMSPEADRGTLEHARESQPSLGPLLVAGFHGGHWPLWHLLQAAVWSSSHATVILQNPREQAEDLDAVWVGSWEEALGEARPVSAALEAASAECGTLFLAGLDTREEVEAITAAAHQFLGDENCRRLGIIVPGAGALSRLVAAALTRQGIAHYDALGQMAPGIFEEPVFQSWMELQRTPRLAALLRFLTALETDHPLFARIPREAIADALHRALGSAAVDDLNILIASARARHGRGELFSDALDQIRFLPSQATFAEHLRVTREAFEQLGWQERWREIERHANWATDLHPEFSRTIYLRWIEEIGNSFRVTRDEAGAHPYACVHLLTPAQAEDQTWSHLILTSLNDRVWPAPPGGDFLPAPQIEALNEKTRLINRAATHRGRQGEGHVTVRAGRALFLGAAQQRRLAEAQFASLLENTTHGVAFTASVIQEDAPERISNPSEFLNRAYHAAHGHSLSQPQMRALRTATRRWLDATVLDPQIAVAETPGIRQTRVAYDARRTIAPSSEYDFALRAAPEQIKPLSVSEVEAMLKTPAIVWLRRYLGVEGEEDSAYAWDATVGKWAHDWLASVSATADGFAAFPSEAEISERIRAAAVSKRTEVEQLCHQGGRRLPDWWESGWEGALCVAQTLGRVLSTAKDWPWLATEWRLDAQPVEFGEGNQLLLRGRADLLLGRTVSAPASLQIPELWIIDFKTGNKDALSKGLKGEEDQRAEKVRRKVLKGDALQLSLYANAAKQTGAGNIRVSLVSPGLAKAEPQLGLEDFEQCRDAFRELARMQATGVFGFKGMLRNAYAFTQPYPIATLAVDPEIVDERWEETHPALVVESGYFR